MFDAMFVTNIFTDKMQTVAFFLIAPDFRSLNLSFSLSL